MSEVKQYIEHLLLQHKLVIDGKNMSLFHEFILDESNIQAVKQIKENQQMMVDKFRIKSRIQDIQQATFQIPNGTVNKAYEAQIDFVKLGLDDLIYTEFVGLDQYGLMYDQELEKIHGFPSTAGDFKVLFKFRIKGENEETEPNEKRISLIINADPKSLWKDIPSTQTAENFWKPDYIADAQPLGDKHIVVASKRGRSHANVGSFRDDDVAFKHFEESGWSVVCVADGAGSAKLSREGSRMACQGIVDFFAENFTPALQQQINEIVEKYEQLSYATTTEVLVEEEKETEEQIIVQESEVAEAILSDEVSVEPEKPPKAIETLQDVQSSLKLYIYEVLGKAVFSVHKQLEDFANEQKIPIKDLHSTLIFALFKKYTHGYAVLTFGVGDCPIGIMNKDQTEVKLMNWLDVGEFGGGTRFITMSEIFNSDKFATRFGFKFIEDFSYLFLMTDGIYDPKFVVEANLDKLEKWQEFLADLQGNNDEKAIVEFNPANEEIATQLSAWMDFWSPGNHDDRTLAVVY